VRHLASDHAACAAAATVKNFLFKAAAAIPIGSFPLLDYLMVTSDSVGAAVRQLKRYLALVDNPHVIEIEDADDPVRVVFVSRDGRPADEFGIALILFRLRDETGEAFRPRYISFQHMPEDTVEIEQMFGCPVRACAAWNGLALSRATWNIPLRRRDPILAKLLRQQADEAIARLPRMEGPLYDLADRERRRGRTSWKAGRTFGPCGASRARRREHDDDLYARVEPWRAWREESSRPVIVVLRAASAMIHIGARDFWRRSAGSVHVYARRGWR
jgi:hypothetical protein